MNRKQFLGIIMQIALFGLVYLAFAGIDYLYMESNKDNEPLIIINRKLNYLILTIITLIYPYWLFYKRFKDIH